MVPWAIVELKALPLTANGKVDRKKLPAVDEAGAEHERQYEGPRTIVEELLCGIWSEVLQVERVGIHDNFFELGGDSILSLRIKAQAQAQGLDFALQALFDHQSIAELAEVVKVTAEAGGGGRSEDGGERLGGEKRGGREPFGLVGAGVREALGEEVEDAYPLSRLQAGMLFHSESEPESAIYHDVICYRVGVGWEQEALERAVAEVVERHQILRTSFEMERFEEPLQVVYRWGQVELGIEDLRGLEKKEQQHVVREWLEEEKKRGFEWRRAPLLRMYVHRLEEESFQWSLSFHHAILDGWSEASLMTELLQRYEAARAGKSLGVEKLRASYRDYMEMERDALVGEESQRFWEEMLSGHRMTPVPLGGGRESQSGEIATSVIELEGGAEEGLRELAARIGAPLKTVLLAGHLQALSLLTGSGDVMSGGGRRRPCAGAVSEPDAVADEDEEDEVGKLDRSGAGDAAGGAAGERASAVSDAGHEAEVCGGRRAAGNGLHVYALPCVSGAAAAGRAGSDQRTGGVRAARSAVLCAVQRRSEDDEDKRVRAA
jgi:hypothetical protein